MNAICVYYTDRYGIYQLNNFTFALKIKSDSNGRASRLNLSARLSKASEIHSGRSDDHMLLRVRLTCKPNLDVCNESPYTQKGPMCIC